MSFLRERVFSPILHSPDVYASTKKGTRLGRIGERSIVGLDLITGENTAEALLGRIIVVHGEAARSVESRRCDAR